MVVRHVNPRKGTFGTEHLLNFPCPLKNRAKTNDSHPPLTLVAVVYNLIVIANLKTEDLGNEKKIDVYSSTSPCIDDC